MLTAFTLRTVLGWLVLAGLGFALVLLLASDWKRPK